MEFIYTFTKKGATLLGVVHKVIEIDILCNSKATDIDKIK